MQHRRAWTGQQPSLRFQHHSPGRLHPGHAERSPNQNMAGGLRNRPTCEIRHDHRHQRAKSNRHQPVLLRRQKLPKRHGGSAHQRHLLPQHSGNLRSAPLPRPDLLRLQRHGPLPRHQSRQRGAPAIRTNYFPISVLLLELLRRFRPLLLPRRVPHRRPRHRRL
ncbi:hypothetical protein M758_8G042400 [Ceratodon purpureus]|nr:hypothetical protein M758_8G042400 [Ceratodon purpureus]